MICSTCKKDHPPEAKCPNAPTAVVTALQRLIGRVVKFRPSRAGAPERHGRLEDAYASTAQIDGNWYNLGPKPEVEFLGVQEAR